MVSPSLTSGLMLRIFALGFIAITIAVTATAQDTPSQTDYIPRQSDRPIPVEGDEPGFRSIFDGKTLDDWAGDPVYWRVENGAIVGEITPKTLVKSNTFIVWQGGQPKDFELKLEARITPEGNSGINYRSEIIPDPVTPENQYAMRGYQCDFDGRNRYTGNNYEEKGRLFLAQRGQLTRVVAGRPPVLISQIGDFDELAEIVRDDWNEVHLIVRGNTMIHMVNGQVMSLVIDDDAPNRPEAGLIGVQVHVGPPMKVEYRNIRLKIL